MTAEPMRWRAPGEPRSPYSCLPRAVPRIDSGDYLRAVVALDGPDALRRALREDLLRMVGPRASSPDEVRLLREYVDEVALPEAVRFWHARLFRPKATERARTRLEADEEPSDVVECSTCRATFVRVRRPGRPRSRCLMCSPPRA